MTTDPVPVSDLIRLAIGLPHYGAHSAMWSAEMWLTLGYALAGSESRFKLAMINFVDACNIEVARNQLVNDAIAKNADWLLMIDADTWHTDGFDILQMISTAAREKFAVVAAPVPRRGGADTHLMIYRHDAVTMRRTPLTLEDLDPRHGSLVSIDSAATALMAIDLNFVKEHLAPPWFRFEWAGRNFISEDLNFCQRVRYRDGKIAATTTFVAHHLQRPAVL